MKIRVIILVLATLLIGQLGAVELININTAGVDELDALPGIGASYAERIIDYREAHGDFQKIEDIKNVSGIGEATFNKIRGLITVQGVTVRESVQNSNSSESLQPSTEKSNKKKFTVSIGKDRLISLGSPTEFNVDSNLDNPKAGKYFWTFGDGSEDQGEEVIHTYEYPGEYVVILKAFNGDVRAAARIEVKVVEPNLTITSVFPERIEIFNQTKYEVNLFGRALVYGSEIYAFPKDTFIKAGEKLSFSSRITGLKPSSQDVSMIILGEKRPSDKQAELTLEKASKISSIKSQIQNLLSQIPMAEIESMDKSNTKLTIETVPERNIEENLAVNGTEKKKHNLLLVLKKFFLNR